MGSSGKSGKIMATVVVILCFFLFFAGFVMADDPCSPEAMASIPGQIVEQIHSSLTFTDKQSRQIFRISSNINTFFEQWQPEQIQRLDVLIMEIQNAREDTIISSEEKEEIKKSFIAWKKGRQNMLKVLVQGIYDVDDVLTDEQKEKLGGLEISIHVPDDVKMALETFKIYLDAALSEYDETGTLSEITETELKEAWQEVVGAMYLPDAVREKMDGKLICVAIKNSGKYAFNQASNNLNIEKAKDAIRKFLEDDDTENITLQELLDYVDNMSGMNNRLGLFLKGAKTSVLEAFMLMPIFNCQFQ